MEAVSFQNAMASLTLKVLVVSLAIVAQHVSTGYMHGSSESSDSSDGHECRGIKRVGEPCQDGAGICTLTGGPGPPYGHMECVLIPTTTHYYPTTHYYDYPM